MNIVNLNFMHPQYGTIFNADVDTSFTAQEMLDNLLLSGFMQKSDLGYHLALQDRILAPDEQLQVLAALYNGAVLRIVEKKKKQQSSPKEKFLWTAQIQHPVLASNIAVKIDSDEKTGTDLVQMLVDKGFLSEFEAGIRLLFRDQELDLAAPLASWNLPQEVFLRLELPKLEGMAKRVEELETKLDQKLQAILDQMPAPSTIPIDPERSINPTADQYESIDALLLAIRRVEGKEPIQKVRIYSPIPWILLFTFLLIILLLFVWALNQ